jgi:hypothetical protein
MKRSDIVLCWCITMFFFTVLCIRMELMEQFQIMSSCEKNISVGDSCPVHKVTPVKGCLQEKSKCQEQRSNIGTLISCSGVIRPSCTISSFASDPNSTELQPYQGLSVRQCVRTRKNLPTCQEEIILLPSGVWEMKCLENGPPSLEYDCPPGSWHGGNKTC